MNKNIGKCRHKIIPLWCKKLSDKIMKLILKGRNSKSISLNNIKSNILYHYFKSFSNLSFIRSSLKRDILLGNYSFFGVTFFALILTIYCSVLTYLFYSSSSPSFVYKANDTRFTFFYFSIYTFGTAGLVVAYSVDM